MLKIQLQELPLDFNEKVEPGESTQLVVHKLPSMDDFIQDSDALTSSQLEKIAKLDLKHKKFYEYVDEGKLFPLTLMTGPGPFPFARNIAEELTFWKVDYSITNLHGIIKDYREYRKVHIDPLQHTENRLVDAVSFNNDYKALCQDFKSEWDSLHSKYQHLTQANEITWNHIAFSGEIYIPEIYGNISESAPFQRVKRVCHVTITTCVPKTLASSDSSGLFFTDKPPNNELRANQGLIEFQDSENNSNQAFNFLHFKNVVVYDIHDPNIGSNLQSNAERIQSILDDKCNCKFVINVTREEMDEFSNMFKLLVDSHEKNKVLVADLDEENQLYMIPMTRIKCLPFKKHPKLAVLTTRLVHTFLGVLIEGNKVPYNQVEQWILVQDFEFDTEKQPDYVKSMKLRPFENGIPPFLANGRSFEKKSNQYDTVSENISDGPKDPRLSSNNQDFQLYLPNDANITQKMLDILEKHSIKVEKSNREKDSECLKIRKDVFDGLYDKRIQSKMKQYADSRESIKRVKTDFDSHRDDLIFELQKSVNPFKKIVDPDLPPTIKIILENGREVANKAIVLREELSNLLSSIEHIDDTPMRVEIHQLEGYLMSIYNSYKMEIGVLSNNESVSVSKTAMRPRDPRLR